MTAGRLVMLVANSVAGDSRVQKAARSMAERGWETTLVGRAPGCVAEEFRLGPARVLLVPVEKRVTALGRRGQAWWAVRDAACGALGGDRAFNPWFHDLEAAFAPVVARLRPDLVHAHDYHMVGVAGRIAARLAEPGRRPVRWVYDAHEYLAGVEVPAVWDVRGRARRRMLRGLERAYIGRADAVVTVSRGIAGRLRDDHGLRVCPTVVLNAPLGAGGDVDAGTGGGAGAGAEAAGLRRAAGLPAEVPVLVYSGGMAPRRGVGTVVDALAALPGAYLVLVARDGDPDVPGLLARAVAAGPGVAERVRVVPYVAPERVVRYLAGATVGVVPLLHRPNHELSLITKYLEYAAARLPILTSDVREMAATTRRLGVGEVFRAGDAASLAEAAGRLLAAPGRYRAAYAPGGPAAELAGCGWESQAEVLDGLYRRLTAGRAAARRGAGGAAGRGAGRDGVPALEG